MLENSFSKMLKVFEETKPKDFTRQPSEKFSSERMGGWLLKDANDMHIGFVSNYGRTTYMNVVETTATNKPRS